MKKIISALLVLCTLFCLTSCVASDKKKLAEMEKSSIAEASSAADAAAAEASVKANGAPASKVPATDKNGESTTFEDLDSVLDSFTPEEESMLNAIGIKTNSKEETVTLAISEELISEAGKDIKVDLDSNGEPAQNSAKQDIKKILGSKKFTFEAIYKMDDQVLPIKYVSDGNKFFVESKIPAAAGLSLTVQIISDGQKGYMVLPASKMYYECATPEDIAELNNLELDDLVETDRTYISSSEVKLNGKTYLCEHYKSNGSEYKYYFLKGELKRIELIYDDGTAVIADIVNLSEKVDSSLFKIPSGYIAISEDLIENAFGG